MPSAGRTRRTVKSTALKDNVGADALTLPLTALFSVTRGARPPDCVPRDPSLPPSIALGALGDAVDTRPCSRCGSASSRRFTLVSQRGTPSVPRPSYPTQVRLRDHTKTAKHTPPAPTSPVRGWRSAAPPRPADAASGNAWWRMARLGSAAPELALLFCSSDIDGGAVAAALQQASAAKGG